MSSIDRITLLRALGGQQASKRFFVATNGSVGISSYGKAKHFQADEIPVTNIADLHRVLVRLEQFPAIFAIRGALIPGVNPACVLRRKAGKGSAFCETPRSWVMLDVDGLTLPAVTSVLDDPQGAAQAVLDHLTEKAPELAGVTAIVCHSSSAGLAELAAAEAVAGLAPRWGSVAKTGVSAHVWYWLRRPLGERELKAWISSLAARGLKVDQATVQTVQPHYVAAPVFAPPLRDPLAGRRTILMLGGDDEAELVIPAVEQHKHTPDGVSHAKSGLFRGAGYRDYIEQIGGALGFYAPIKSAIGSCILYHKSEGDFEQLKVAIRERIDRADPAHRAPADIARYQSDEFLDGLIAWTLEQERTKPAQPTPPPTSHRLPPYFAEPAEAREDALARQTALISDTVRDAALRAGINRQVAAAAKADAKKWAERNPKDAADD